MKLPNLEDLNLALDSDASADVLGAAWDAFDVAARLASAVAFNEGSDEGLALITVMHCNEGRSMLPLPETGAPLELPEMLEGSAALEPYRALLRHVDTALRRLSTTAEARAVAERLEQVAEQAILCADFLGAIRPGQGVAA